MLRTTFRTSVSRLARAQPLRSVQTSADGSEVVGTVPSDKSEEFTVRLHPEYFKSYKCDTPDLDVKVTGNLLIDMYQKMVVNRRMEMAADQLYKAKLIRGFCHLAIGQEAVAVGMHEAINPEDRIITSYRCHPFIVLRGGTVKDVLAELMGRADGISKGKGGSMHMFTPTFYGGNGIVGAQVPLGAGIALAQQYLGQDKDHATFAMYGDGASNQGQVFESFNMAKLWNLPCIFLCENNLYGMGTSAQRSSANTLYYTRGDTIPGIQVNAMDVLSVYRTIQHAKEWTQSGKGPLIVEAVTYRYGGHSMSDPGTTYRTREEVQHMRSSNDPITGLRNKIINWGVLSEAELKQIDKEVRAEVEHQVEEAKKSPVPSPDKYLWTDIYVQGTNPKFMRGRESQEIHRFGPEETNL